MKQVFNLSYTQGNILIKARCGPYPRCNIDFLLNRIDSQDYDPIFFITIQTKFLPANKNKRIPFV